MHSQLILYIYEIYYMIVEYCDVTRVTCTVKIIFTVDNINASSIAFSHEFGIFSYLT